jgi:hypothetical protein
VKLARRDPPGDPSAVDDVVQGLETMAAGAAMVEEVTQRIGAMFEDDIADSKRVLLRSTHKAKGRERERVWGRRDTYRKRPNVEKDPLGYVAVTRAKGALRLASGGVDSQEQAS